MLERFVLPPSSAKPFLPPALLPMSAGAPCQPFTPHLTREPGFLRPLKSSHQRVTAGLLSSAWGTKGSFLLRLPHVKFS